MKKIIFKDIITVVLVIAGFLGVFFSSAFYAREKCEEIYNEGVSLLEHGKSIEAVERFNDIGDNYINYQDIKELLIKYNVDFVCLHCGKMLN